MLHSAHQRPKVYIAGKELKAVERKVTHIVLDVQNIDFRALLQAAERFGTADNTCSWSKLLISTKTAFTPALMIKGADNI